MGRPSIHLWQACKSTSPEPSWKEAANKTKSRDILQNDWPVLFRSVKVKKNKVRPRAWSRLKETKDTWQLNATCDFQLDSFALKAIIGIRENLTGAWWLNGYKVLVSISWWNGGMWLYRRCSSLTRKSHYVVWEWMSIDWADILISIDSGQKGYLWCLQLFCKCEIISNKKWKVKEFPWML